MKKSIAKKWVAALRSGQYAQGVGNLREGGAFCCLGVLCDLHSTITGKGQWDGGEYHAGCESDCMVPPDNVCEWAGMQENNPDMESDYITLAEMNDAGASFAEIADKIEANWETL